MRPDPSSAPDPAPRRALLRPIANPAPGLDYLVTLDGPLADGGAVRVRYVPDRSVISADVLEDYLREAAAAAAAAGGGAARPEGLAALILGDIGNEVLPRWLEVALTPLARGAVRQAVVMQERQPRWDNPALLARLKPL